jgi:hypothetical protein
MKKVGRTLICDESITVRYLLDMIAAWRNRNTTQSLGSHRSFPSGGPGRRRACPRHHRHHPRSPDQRPGPAGPRRAPADPAPAPAMALGTGLGQPAHRDPPTTRRLSRPPPDIGGPTGEPQWKTGQTGGLRASQCNHPRKRRSTISRERSRKPVGGSGLSCR